MGEVRFRRRAFDTIYGRLRGQTKLKEFHELRFWKQRLNEEDDLSADSHYEHLFTKCLGLATHDYAGARMLDVGCGPRGSLEWAKEIADERVGLDPLANEYARLGTIKHSMRYFHGRSEAMPFADDYFDFTSSVNSLDHVESVDQTAAEMVRVTRRGGRILILTHVNHEPTACEPQAFGFDVVDRFPGTRVAWVRRLEHPPEHGWQVEFDELAPNPGRLAGLAAVLEVT